jgi:hypothetical protein
VAPLYPQRQHALTSESVSRRGESRGGGRRKRNANSLLLGGVANLKSSIQRLPQLRPFYLHSFDESRLRVAGDATSWTRAQWSPSAEPSHGAH